MKKITVMTVIFLCVSVMAGSMKDPRDGKKYKTVKIGNQEWMAENLNYNVDGSLCYEENPANCKKHGRLYTWQAALEACPEGWHLPKRAEFGEIYKLANGESNKLKTKKGWALDKGGYCIEYGCDYSAFGRKRVQQCHPINKKCGCGQGKSVCKRQQPYDYNGTDNYGFSALPAGWHNVIGTIVEFKEIGKGAYFWSSTEKDDYRAYALSIRPTAWSYTSLLYNEEADWSKTSRLSIRCIRGSSEISAEQGSMTDPRDGTTYKTTKIGNQTWMAENMNYDSGKNKCYDNDPTNCEKHGRLYDWETAKEICPSGWHLPSTNEFDALLDNVGQPKSQGANLRAQSWDGENLYGFSAEPGSCSGYEEFCSTFSNYSAEFWTSTERNEYRAYYMNIDKSNVPNANYYGEKYNGKFVRCLQD